MKNKTKENAKIGKIVSMTLVFLTLLIFTTTAHASVNTHIEEDDDTVRLIVENTGDNPAYVLNSLSVSDEKGNDIYTSQERSSAEVLRINPGKKYTFEWDTQDVPEGNYKEKIYQGDNSKNLKSISIDCKIKPKPGKLIFYTDEKFYKFGKSVDVIIKNNARGTIYVNVNNWKIINLETQKVVKTLSDDCTFGYGGCADSFKPFKFMQKLKQTWDQKDNNGKQVASGSYMVTAEYSNRDPTSGRRDIQTISTKKFFIRPQGKEKDEKDHRDDNRED